jgi:arginase
VQIVVVDAPSNLGLRPPARGKEPGVRRLPDRLRAHRLLKRIDAADGGRIPAPPYDPTIDPTTGVRNAQAIASYSLQLAAAVQPIVSSGAFPLVLGGDCSVLLGPLLALRRQGRYGLCFIDGHLDLLTPETSASKGAAGMDLALAIGYGPDLLADLDGLRPLVQDSHVVALGYRGGTEGYGALTEPATLPPLLWLPLTDVRNQGPGAAADAALSLFERARLQGFWIHLDVDVLDDAVMPAVDSRQPDGLSYEELSAVLRRLLLSPLAVGMEVTILDPDLDPDGRIIESFVGFLEEAFSNPA